MRKQLIMAALAAATVFSAPAMAGKVNPEIVLGANTSGTILGNQALANALSNMIGGNVPAFLARLAGLPGVSFSDAGAASFGLNVDGKVYDVTVSPNGDVDAKLRS